ncbi:MAG: hypothetical protein FJ100_22010 [Deltaproteobacteria bacterium]|nr:hypothetical protein [Deltaproteobacteria bacterium]
MAAPPASRAPEPAGGGGRNWLVIGLLGGGGLVAAAVALWLLTGGMATLARMLPEGVVKTLGERPGEGKRVEQKLHDYPGESVREASEKEREAPPPADAWAAPAAEVDPEELVKLLQPLEAQAKSADAAIEAVRENRGRDQAVVLAGEQAVEALRTFKLVDVPQRYRKAAEDKRKALANERNEALASAKRLAKATHLVAVPDGAARDSVVLRSAGGEASENLGLLDDGMLVKVHLDTGKGWMRIDVLSGTNAGKGGYLQGRYLKRLPDAR